MGQILAYKNIIKYAKIFCPFDGAIPNNPTSFLSLFNLKIKKIKSNPIELEYEKDESGNFLIKNSSITNLCCEIESIYGTNRNENVTYFIAERNEQFDNEASYRTETKSKHTFIFLPAKGLWQQVILQNFLLHSGLGIEYEYPEKEFQNPSEDQILELANRFPNLSFLNLKIDNLSINKTKWRKFQHREELAIIHKKGDLLNMPNSSIDSLLFSPEKISLWEGGGGYRTKVFRTAHDCLMRRRIGDKNLSLRGSKVPLCPACENYLRAKILEFGRKNNIEDLDFRGFIQKI